MINILYLAGYFDGEGFVTVQFHSWVRRGKQYSGYQLHTGIGNTYKPLLDEVQQEFGGKIDIGKKRLPQHRQFYTWRATGDTARNFLQSLLPYLYEKKEQVNLALQMPHNAVRDENDLILQEQIYQEVKRLKRLEY